MAAYGHSANSMVQGHVRDHPDASLMADASLFRFVLDQSSHAAAPADERRAIWDRFLDEQHRAGMPSLSSPRSSLGQTLHLRQHHPGLLADLGVTRVLDAPCGDSHWLSHVALPCPCIGIDLVPELVAANRARYPGHEFAVADLVVDPLPAADAVLCRDALVHCDFALIARILAILKGSRAT